MKGAEQREGLIDGPASVERRETHPAPPVIAAWHMMKDGLKTTNQDQGIILA